MVSEAPTGAVNLNVDGRSVMGPLQGFGQLWQKTYRAELSGADVTPAEVVKIWKEKLPEFQPPQNHFYPSMAGVKPGEACARRGHGRVAQTSAHAAGGPARSPQVPARRGLTRHAHPRGPARRTLPRHPRFRQRHSMTLAPRRSR
jgi:hypothetical protein